MIIATVRDRELSDAFALLFGSSTASIDVRAAHAFRLVASGAIEADDVIVARKDDAVIGAVYGALLPGSTAVVWPPRLIRMDVTIEDDVLIASHVSIINGCHQHGTERLDIPLREQRGRFERVTIGRDSWIGERATVAANVGRHCIIGAGSLVLSPVPDYGIAVGVPARVIRDRRQSATATSQEGGIGASRNEKRPIGST